MFGHRSNNLLGRVSKFLVEIIYVLLFILFDGGITTIFILFNHQDISADIAILCFYFFVENES